VVFFPVEEQVVDYSQAEAVEADFYLVEELEVEVVCSIIKELEELEAGFSLVVALAVVFSPVEELVVDCSQEEAPEAGFYLAVEEVQEADYLVICLAVVVLAAAQAEGCSQVLEELVLVEDSFQVSVAEELVVDFSQVEEQAAGCSQEEELEAGFCQAEGLEADCFQASVEAQLKALDRVARSLCSIKAHISEEEDKINTVSH